jgi:hypothetical protein
MPGCAAVGRSVASQDRMVSASLTRSHWTLLLVEHGEAVRPLGGLVQRVVRAVLADPGVPVLQLAQVVGDDGGGEPEGDQGAAGELHVAAVMLPVA